MGSNNSISRKKISIQYLNGNKNIFQTGQYVEGIIQFINDNNNEEIEVCNLIIELTGELVYTNNERKGRTIVTTTEKIHFYIKRIILNSSNDKNKLILKNENNKWSFIFHLPNQIPSSFQQINDQGPFIHYFIRVRSSLYPTNFIFKKDFPIIVQRPSQLINSISSQIDNNYQNDLQLKIFISNNSFIVGQHLPIQIRLHNPNHIKIHRISLTLIQLRKLGPVKEERQQLFKHYLTNLDKFNNENYVDNIQLDIPDEIDPSCSYYLPFKSAQWLFFVHYELYFKIHINGINNNISLRIPVTINNKTEAIVEQIKPSKADSFIFNLNESQS